MGKASTTAVCLLLLALARQVVAQPDHGDEDIQDTTLEREVLTLQRAREVMSERNFELEINRQAIEQAALLEDQALALVLPSLDIAGSLIIREEETVIEFGNTYAPLLPYLESVYAMDTSLEQYFQDNPGIPDARMLAQLPSEPMTVTNQIDWQVTATLTQTIYNARAFPLLDQAEIMLSQAETVYEAVEFELIGALYRLYFNAVRYARLIEAAERNIDLAALTLERAQVAYEEDVGNRFEVTRAEVALQQADREWENAKLAYELAVESLAVLLNIPGDFDTIEPPALDQPAHQDDLFEQALNSRPDLENLRLMMMFHEERIDEVRSEWWPILQLQGQSVIREESAFSGDMVAWQLIFIANWSIWDGGIRIAERQVREFDLIQSQLRLEQAAAQVESTIDQAFLRVQGQQRLVSSARAEVELAQENMELTQDAFDLGAATSLDVQMAQQQLHLSEVTLASSEIELQYLIYELYRLSGDL